MLLEEFEEGDPNYQDGNSRGPCSGCLLESNLQESQEDVEEVQDGW